MFTAQEAVSFLQTKWGIERVDERFHDVSRRKDLLEEIIRMIHEKVPFQNITLMATPLSERKRPTVTTIKEECMTGIGGVCYNINAFVWGLLKGLGFRVQLCLAQVCSPEDHLVVLLHGLEKQGDFHLVECGSGFPTFRAIPLDFEEESPVFVESYLEYKYVRRDGKILRLHGDGDTFKRDYPSFGDSDGSKWGVFYSFTPEPSDDLSVCDDAFDRVFTIQGFTPFHSTLVAVAFPKQRAIRLVRNQIMVEKEDGKMETTSLDGDEAIVDSYCRYFPALQEAIVRKAVYEWHNSSDGSLGKSS